MADIQEIIKNIEQIYHSNNSLNLLKDFERVIDELDLYVYDNWIDGELMTGPRASRYFVECTFMWPKHRMPDPAGGLKLINYGCKVEWGEDYVAKVRKIKTPDDMRPGTKKGKIDYYPVWLVKITMPKKLMASIQTGYEQLDQNTIEDILNTTPTTTKLDPADEQDPLELEDENTDDLEL